MMTPSQFYSRTAYKKPRKLLSGLDAVVHGIEGRLRSRGSALSELRLDAEAVDRTAERWGAMSDHDLRQRLLEFREQFRRGGGEAEGSLLEALGALREAADRKLGLRPFKVQLMGALALHRGWLAEMATGEGKTLTAGVAAVLSGWSRKPCHVITVNDYLVQRDSEWMRPFYQFCGVKVGFVTGGMPPDKRREGHDQDITYTTSKELLADFLRDRLQLGQLRFPTQRLIRKVLRPARNAARDGLVLRGLHTAIVDEADSVLIDEAVTPLIISRPRENRALEEVVKLAHRIVEPLEAGVDYTIDHRYREIELTDRGKEKVREECDKLPGIWRGMERRDELIRQSLVAREFFLPGKQYIIVDGKVVIVDEFTGRPMPQRSWRQGMHQAIEAKEELEISSPAETVARLSFQRFFRFFHRLSGMTGTAREAAGEFWQIYRLRMISLPTNRPCIREQWPDRIFADEADKWAAVVAEIKRIHATGRPILVGTRSVTSSEHLARLLAEEHIDFQLLNAVHHIEEAKLIVNAGEEGRVTIATNMAGRGTDIKLGKRIAANGGLHVLATERHESGRVDRQLFGRSGRQGDPGTAQAFVCVEDELLRKFLKKTLQRAVTRSLKAGLPSARTAARAAFGIAQRNAQKAAFKQRKSVLKMDTWMDEALSFTGVEDV